MSSHDRLLSSNLDIVSVLIARRFKQERVKWHNKQQRLRLVSPRAASLPLCSSRRLLPTATAADVAAAWALLPSSTVRCVSYSLLVCCCCATLLLLRSSYFPAILPPGTTPPPCATRFSDISSSFRQTPDCSDILTYFSCFKIA